MTGPIDQYDYNYDIFTQVGQLDNLTFPGDIAYPVQYEELQEHYQFRGGVILHSPGIYYLRFSTNRIIIDEDYDHPALYDCDGDRRTDIWVVYLNQASTQENYDNLFRKTGVEDFLRLIDYDRYVRFGGQTFVVKE